MELLMTAAYVSSIIIIVVATVAEIVVSLNSQFAIMVNVAQKKVS